MGLPSILFAKSNPLSEIILTDRPVPDLSTWLENMDHMCKINGLDSQVTLLPLFWGCFDTHLLSIQNRSIDAIIASDCFYDPRDFDDVLATVRYFFDHHHCKSFITTYHERSENRNLQFLLNKWRFESVIEVPLESFMSLDIFERIFDQPPSEIISSKFTDTMSTVKLFIIK